MATKVITTVQDDLDGSEGASTISFMFDGTSYEIDLNEKNAKKMASALSPYIAAARRMGRAARSTRPSRVRELGYNTTEVRNWAKENGVQVGDKGRIPGVIVEQYQAAMNGNAGKPKPAKRPGRKATAGAASE